MNNEFDFPKTLPAGNDGLLLYKFESMFHRDNNNLSRGFFHENTWPIGMHSHEFYEINIITNGSGRHYINNHSIPVKKGDVFMLPPNIVHGYHNSDNLRMFNLLISTSFFQHLSYETDNIRGLDFLMDIEPSLRANLAYENHVCIDEHNLEHLMFFLRTMEKLHLKEFSSYSANNYEKNDYTLMNSLTLYILTFICNYYDKLPTNKYQKNRKKNSIFLALEYIHRNFHEQIAIEKLASLSNLSQSTFLRYFKEIVSVTPGIYIRDLRLSHSKKLLETTEMSIASIATECGFFDSSHYELNFKKIFHCTPKEYRKSLSTTE